MDLFERKGIQPMLIADLISSRCPFEILPPNHENARWINPVVCTVQYMPSDKPGMRQPVFKGFREDKVPEDLMNHSV